MSPITHDEAFNATSSDPASYPGLGPNPSEEALNARRESAAQAIMQGIAANDQYWDSRSNLEALQARADGHGVVTPPESSPAAADAEATAVDTPEPAGHLQAGEATEPTDAEVVENPADGDALTKLRAQLRNAGINPEA